MVLILEDLREKLSALKMLVKSLLGSFLIEFKRNYIVRLQISREISRHYNRVVTICAL